MANGFKVDNAPGAPGINIWSRGPIYPLVIARRERYASGPSANAVFFNGPILAKAIYDNGSIGARLDCVSFDVLNADDEMSGFASYDDALEAAKGWLDAKREREFRAALAWGAPKPVLSPFNPAAFDADLADDYEDELMRDLRADAVAAMGGA